MRARSSSKYFDRPEAMYIATINDCLQQVWPSTSILSPQHISEKHPFVRSILITNKSRYIWVLCPVSSITPSKVTENHLSNSYCGGGLMALGTSSLAASLADPLDPAAFCSHAAGSLCDWGDMVCFSDTDAYESRVSS